MPGSGPSPGAGSAGRRRASWVFLGLVAAAVLVVGALAAAGFDDDEGTVHEPAVDALADRGVLAGTECGTDRICPAEEIERWVMAVWLIRALGESPSAAPVRFADVDPDAWWAPYVERLAGLRVTQGCATGPARYCPDDPVTRGQMATFLARALDLEPAPPAGFFDTFGHVHAANIDALAAVGITAGCATEPARYCPDAPVTRGQMATFLARALNLVPLPEPRATGPDTGFTAVSVGSGHACGIRIDRTVECWGSNHSKEATPPDGWFTSVSAGSEHTCGIRTDRTITCWGSDEHGQSRPTPGLFTAVAAGGRHSCGLRASGALFCWGSDDAGQLDAPDGRFTAVSAGWSSSCGIRPDETITCWGTVSGLGLDPPDGQFTALASGDFWWCGVRVDRSIACWAYSQNQRWDIRNAEFGGLALGSHVCGLRTDGTADCRGSNAYGQLDAPEGGFTSLSAGGNHTCGLRRDGTIDCWGGDGWGGFGTTAPEGHFTSIVTGHEHSCGLRLDGSADCWGSNPYGELEGPAGPFQSLFSSGSGNCGLRDDSTVACWGSVAENPPGIRLTSIAVGAEHACGLRDDGTILCWGSNHEGQTGAPGGRFSAVTAGAWFSCGLRTDGTIACWGPTTAGRRRHRADDSPP